MSNKIVEAAKEELVGLQEEIKHVETVLKELKQAEKKLNRVIVDFSDLPEVVEAAPVVVPGPVDSKSE